MARKNDLLVLLALLLAASPVGAAKDLVYTADEVSNTVSVINPTDNTLLGLIHLGPARPNIASALPPYGSNVNVHGLDLSPDKKILAVTANLSNSVTFISTQNNSILGQVYVGRSPHISSWSPDGKELWSAARADSYLYIIDPKIYRVKRQIPIEPGASHVLFLKDKPIAFVANAISPIVQIFDTRTYKLIKTLPLKGKVTPNGRIFPERKELWLVQKDIDQVVRIDTEKLAVKDYFFTGPFTQHIAPGGKKYGSRAFATIGGENRVAVYDISGDKPREIASTYTGGVPHGIWSDPDGEYIYVGLEYTDEVVVLSASANYRVIKRINIGNSPQAVLYAENITQGELNRSKLDPLWSKNIVRNLSLVSPSDKDRKLWGTLTVRQQGPVDSLEIFTYGSLAGDPLAARAKIYGWMQKLSLGLVKPRIRNLGQFRTSPKGGGSITLLFPAPDTFAREELFHPSTVVEVFNPEDPKAGPLLISRH